MKVIRAIKVIEKIKCKHYLMYVLSEITDHPLACNFEDKVAVWQNQKLLHLYNDGLEQELHSCQRRATCIDENEKRIVPEKNNYQDVYHCLKKMKDGSNDYVDDDIFGSSKNIERYENMTKKLQECMIGKKCNQVLNAKISFNGTTAGNYEKKNYTLQIYLSKKIDVSILGQNKTFFKCCRTFFG